MASLGKIFYSGLFRHALDDKNRLTIPAAWRPTATEENLPYLATPHPDGYLAVLPPAEVEKLHEKIAAKALTDRDAQEAFALFLSECLSFHFDKQGRFGLPENLLQHAGLGKEVVLVGVGNKFGLYSPETWEKVRQRSGGDSAGDRLRRIGI